MKELIKEQTNKQEWRNDYISKWKNKNEGINLWTTEQTRMKELIYEQLNKQLNKQEWRN